MRSTGVLSVAATAAALFVAACGGGGGGGSSGGGMGGMGGTGGTGGTGTLEVRVTDAPFAHNLVTQATIEVFKVDIHQNAGATSGFVTLFDNPAAPLSFDLVDLRNGVSAFLTSAQLPVGLYRQLRLFTSAAELTLSNGATYSTAATPPTIHLTSQGQSGFKVFIDPPIEVVAGVTTTLLLDFDLTRTFLPIPAGGPHQAQRFNLLPVIRATNPSASGDIRGVVSDANGVVNGATVELFQAGTTTSVATTSTDATGAYMFPAVAPGTYDVTATSGALTATAMSVTVNAGGVTTVDLTVQ